MIKQLKYLVFAFCLILVVFRTINISVYTEGRARSAILGDAFSDINTISSAKYFLDSGFIKTSFLPMHNYYPANNAPALIYTHYPAIPNILAGIYATIFNSVDERLLRIVPILLAIFFFFFIYKVLYTFIQQEQAAFIGSCVLWLGSYYINWADNIHQHLYGECLKWIYVYLLFRYHEGNKKPITLLLWMLLIMVIEVNISFEQPVFLGMATLGFSIVYKQGIFNKETILAFVALLVGLGLHFLQNMVYFGSAAAALQDFIHAFSFRSTGAETIGYIKEKAYTWHNFPEIVFGWFNGMERFYLLPGWTILCLWLLLYKTVRQQHLKLFQLSVVLFIAGAAWGFVMSQHAYIHAFTNKHFSVFVGLSAAILVPLYLQKIKVDFRTGNIGVKVFHSLLIGYTMLMLLTQQVWEIWIKFGYCYPYFGY